MGTFTSTAIALAVGMAAFATTAGISSLGITFSTFLFGNGLIEEFVDVLAMVQLFVKVNQLIQIIKVGG